MNSSCKIVSLDTANTKTYALDDLPNLSGFSYKSSEQTLQVDLKIEPEYEKSWQTALKIREALVGVLKTISTPLITLGVVSFLAFGLRRNSSKKTRLFFLALLSVFLLRTALLVAIDIHSFPAVNSLYMAPSLILVPIISIVGVSFLWEFLRRGSSPDERQS